MPDCGARRAGITSRHVESERPFAEAAWPLHRSGCRSFVCWRPRARSSADGWAAPRWYRFPLFICSLAVLSLGAAFSNRVVRLLRRGVLDGRWKVSELEPLRRFMCIPGLEEISTLCIIVGGVSAFFPHTMWPWCRFLLPLGAPLFGFPNLKKTLTAPQTTETRLAEPSVYTPLSSDHWGGLP